MQDKTYNYDEEHADAVMLTKLSFTIAAIAGFIFNLKQILTLVLLIFAVFYAFYSTKNMVREV
jgi:hypothetical protein